MYCDGSHCRSPDCPDHGERFIKQRRRQARRAEINRIAAGHACEGSHCHHESHYMSSRTPSPAPSPPPSHKPAARPRTPLTRAKIVGDTVSPEWRDVKQNESPESASHKPQQAAASPVPPVGGAAQADKQTPRPVANRSMSRLSRCSAQVVSSQPPVSSRRSSTSSAGSYHKVDGPWVGKQMVPAGPNKFQVTYERPAVKRKVVIVNPEQVAWMMQQMLTKVECMPMRREYFCSSLAW